MSLQRDASNLAREHTETAIDTLADILSDPMSETRERIAAANSLLDRGHGKPAQAIIALPASKRQQAMLAALSDDELMAAITQAPLKRLAPIEAEFVPAAQTGGEDDPLLG